MTMFKFITTYLLLTTFCWAQSPLPASCFGPNGEFDRSCWTDPTCKIPDEKPTGSEKCCPGLTLNEAGFCDEVSLQDPALVKCSSQSDCASGLGCLPQRASDLFSSLSTNSENPNIQSDKRSIITNQLNSPLKPAGASCAHSRDCESYSCVSGTCEQRQVCRYAGMGEGAGPGVSCGPGLVKNSSGVCDLSTEAKNMIYPGLIEDTTLKTVGQCQMAVNEDTLEKSRIAMSSLRAMEWFLSTISVPEEQECFRVLPILKQQIGIELQGQRKNILKNFTEVLNGIEKDYKQLLEAKEKSPTMLTIHNGEQISEGDLASRQTSGYDGLMIMYRRNLLFESLEKSMNTAVTSINQNVIDLSQGIGTWADNDESWKIGNQLIQAYDCKGSMYQKKGILSGWKDKYYDKVKDRWSVHYEVKGSHAANADIIKRENVAKYLGLIGANSPEEAISTFTKPKYYMIDPMLFAGLSNKNFGSTKELKKKSSFLGLFGGFRDLRKAYHLDGAGSGSFTAIHSALRPKLKEYFKSLKLDPAQKGFVYEPELLTTEAKDCLGTPEKPENCAPFEPFLETVLDQGFAHFLAYSYHNQDSYEGFFQNATTYRRKLLAKLEVDLQNLQSYYDATSKLRSEQNLCIEKVINGIIENRILVNGKGGVAEDTRGPTSPGEVNGGGVPGSLGNGNLQGLASGATRNGATKVGPTTRDNFRFDLLGSNPVKLSSTKTNLSGEGSSIGSRAGLSSSGTNQLAARRKALLDANAKAKAAGVNVSSKQQKVDEIIASMNRSSGSSGSPSSTSASQSGLNSSRSSNFKGIDTEKTTSTNTIETHTSTPGETVGSGGQRNAEQIGVITSYGSEGTSGESSSLAFRKSTEALSEADKNWVMQSYERNQSDYQERDTDELFERVSKAYVRNLGKILVRKKLD